MTAGEVLAEIQQRADAHHLAASGATHDDMPGNGHFSVTNWADKPHRLVYDLANDSRRLVAALTAVLDLHPPTEDVDARDETGERFYALDGLWCGNERCGVGTVPYPCETVKAITAALGADQ